MINDPAFDWLQRFFQGLCDGVWEHDLNYCCHIESTPELGWKFKFNLINTPFEDIELDEFFDGEPPANWLKCHMRDGEFIAACSALRLVECIEILRDVVEGRRGILRVNDPPPSELGADSI